MPELFSTSFFNDANLVSYWRMEGNSNDAKDGNNGTDTAITYSAANGKFGQGAGFNGTTSVIDPTNNANMRFSGNFSVGAWFKLPSGVGNYAIFTMYTQNSNVAGYELGINIAATGVHNLSFLSGKNTGGVQGTDFQVASGATTVDDNTYHFGVGVWNGSNLLVYVDGAQDGSVAWANAPVYAVSPNCRIGAEVPVATPGKFWPGVLDDVFVFSRALTANEVSTLFRGGGGFFNFF